MRKMRNALASAVAMLLTGSAIAAEPIDSATFYASRLGQVFKGTTPEALSGGYVEGDETPYQTWEGSISGKKLYLELHGDKLKLYVERRKFMLSLGSAFKLPSEQPTALDSRGTDLYVRPGQGAHGSALCIESLLADVSRSTPHRSVYLITDPLGVPRLYQFPTLYASCKGLEEVMPGVYIVPRWTESTDTTPHTFSIQFYTLGKTGFTPTDQRVTATGVGDKIDEFVIDKIEK